MIMTTMMMMMMMMMMMATNGFTKNQNVSIMNKFKNDLKMI
jgi:hypothetical protein